MRIGIHYPHPLYAGGGEKYLLRIAQALAEDNAVDFYCPPPLQPRDLEEKLNCNLDGVHFILHQRPIGYLQEMIGHARRPYDLFIEMTSHHARIASLGRKGILIIQFPRVVGNRSPVNKRRDDSYDAVWCFSQFTRDWILRRRGRLAQVIFPPIDIKVEPRAKANIILSVGRFFAGFHNKKHLAMIDCFKRLVAHGLHGWEYHLVGSSREEGEHHDYLAKVRIAASGAPIFIHPDLSGQDLRDLYARTRIFWHATGYREDGQAYPERLEHFGMTTVEAMAAGAVPAAFDGGGQPEIIEHGHSGFLWREPQELAGYTLRLARDHLLWEHMSRGARESSHRFSAERFRREVLDATHSLLRTAPGEGEGASGEKAHKRELCERK